MNQRKRLPPKRTRRPVENDLVTYEVTLDERRRLRASNVRFSTEEAGTGRPGPSSIPVAAALVFFTVVDGVVLAGRLPLAVLVLYLGASAVAFAAYALDKSAARRDRWRTSESTLHLLGLAGGWPGALLAQGLLRHKSSKVEFQRVFWATVVLNCVALGWLFTETGSAFLAPLLAHGGR